MGAYRRGDAPPGPPARIGHAPGQGGIVTLDTLQTNIAQLVYAEHVKVLPAAKKAAPKTPASTPAEPKA